jgi:hypothetical protein
VPHSGVMSDSRQLEIISAATFASDLATQFFTGLKRHLPVIAEIRSMKSLTTTLADAAEQILRCTEASNECHTDFARGAFIANSLSRILEIDDRAIDTCEVHAV